MRPYQTLSSCFAIPSLFLFMARVHIALSIPQPERFTIHIISLNSTEGKDLLNWALTKKGCATPHCDRDRKREIKCAAFICNSQHPQIFQNYHAYSVISLKSPSVLYDASTPLSHIQTHSHTNTQVLSSSQRMLCLLRTFSHYLTPPTTLTA